MSSLDMQVNKKNDRSTIGEEYLMIFASPKLLLIPVEFRCQPENLVISNISNKNYNSQRV
jgi:hypothetical protein